MSGFKQIDGDDEHYQVWINTDLINLVSITHYKIGDKEWWSVSVYGANDFESNWEFRNWGLADDFARNLMGI